MDVDTRGRAGEFDPFYYLKPTGAAVQESVETRMEAADMLETASLSL